MVPQRLATLGRRFKLTLRLFASMFPARRSSRLAPIPFTLVYDPSSSILSLFLLVSLSHFRVLSAQTHPTVLTRQIPAVDDSKCVKLSQFTLARLVFRSVTPAVSSPFVRRPRGAANLCSCCSDSSFARTMSPWLRDESQSVADNRTMLQGSSTPSSTVLA